MNQENATDDEIWEQLSPMLDDALKQLEEQDRLAVLLRFFQKKPMREVGETLGVSEAAAKMRVSRAVDAGAAIEGEIQTHNWGRIAHLADPFGHGICFIEFLGRGYDEIAQDT